MLTNNQEFRGLLKLRHPIEHGIVTNWEDMERLWASIYSKDQLQIASEEHPVLLTEPPLNPRRNRERAAEVRGFFTLNIKINVFHRFSSSPSTSLLCLSPCRPFSACKWSIHLISMTGINHLGRYASGRTTGVVPVSYTHLTLPTIYSV